MESAPKTAEKHEYAHLALVLDPKFSMRATDYFAPKRDLVRVAIIGVKTIPTWGISLTVCKAPYSQRATSEADVPDDGVEVERPGVFEVRNETNAEGPCGWVRRS